MSSRYHVEYSEPALGRTYGIANNFYAKTATAQEKKLHKQGKVEVDHILYPGYSVVDEKDLVDIPLISGEYGHLDGPTGLFLGHSSPAENYVVLVGILHDLYEAVLKGSKVQVGHQFRVGVADGSAYYVVTKVARVNCDVEWRGFCPDRYRDHHFMWGGSFPKRDVERYLHFGRVESEIFGEQTKGYLAAKAKLFPKLYREFKKAHGFIPKDVEDYVKVLRIKV